MTTRRICRFPPPSPPPPRTAPRCGNRRRGPAPGPAWPAGRPVRPRAPAGRRGCAPAGIHRAGARPPAHSCPLAGRPCSRAGPAAKWIRWGRGAMGSWCLLRVDATGWRVAGGQRTRAMPRARVRPAARAARRHSTRHGRTCKGIVSCARRRPGMPSLRPRHATATALPTPCSPLAAFSRTFAPLSC